MVDHKPILELVGITKQFPGVTACDRVDLAVLPAQVHAIVGENGAGKSTLMSILYGLYAPEEGHILVRGAEISFKSPLEAMDAGLGMVFQDFKQFPTLTVAENIIYRDEPMLGRMMLDLPKANRRVADLGDQYGLAVDPRARIEDLSVGERQRVEILKALYRDAQILILDEPTGVLTPQETDALFDVLRRLRSDGRTIILVTHKLREVMELSDRVTVLRGGQVAAERETSETNPTELSTFMTGRVVDLTARVPEREPGSVVLTVDDLTVVSEEGLEVVSGVSLHVGEGEIVGIAAIAGNGQEDLMSSIAGLSSCAAGSVSVGGTPIDKTSVEERRRRFAAYIPEDRHGLGSASQGSIAENLLMGYQREGRIQRRHFLRRGAVDAHASQLIGRYDIAAPEPRDAVAVLSGGNLQKVIVAREMGHEMPILLAEQPTRGVDVGAIEYIHGQILEYRDRGGAVLLVSAELGELMALSSRILVMYEGRIVAELDPVETTESEIGLFMAGVFGTGDQEHADD